MKLETKVLIVCFILLAFSCAPAAKTEQSLAPSPDPDVPIANAIVKDPSGNTLAYFLGFRAGSNFPSSGMFQTPGGDLVSIEMITGQIELETVWFHTADCSGPAYVPNDLLSGGYDSMAPNRVIQMNGRAYKVTGYCSGLTATTVSRWSMSGCMADTSGHITDGSYNTPCYTLSSTALVTDLSSVAPVQLSQ